MVTAALQVGNLTVTGKKAFSSTTWHSSRPPQLPHHFHTCRCCIWPLTPSTLGIFVQGQAFAGGRDQQGQFTSLSGNNSVKQIQKSHVGPKRGRLHTDHPLPLSTQFISCLASTRTRNLRALLLRCQVGRKVAHTSQAVRSGPRLAEQVQAR